jgi:tetratricopeptide (TPR) repeat protein
MQLLKTIRGSAYSRVWLYKALAHIGKWEYAKSLPWLDRFVKHPSTDPYSRLVGRLNQAAAWIFLGEHWKAIPVLRRLVRETHASGYALLYGNSYELLSAALLWRGRYEEARKTLGEAERALRDGALIESLLVEKWKTALEVLSTKASPPSLAALERFRKKARERGHWNSVRDCDRIRAVAAGDVDLARRLAAGTPSWDYRRRLQTELPSLELEADSHWGGTARRMDLLSGRDDRGTVVVELGSTLHRLLAALLEDSYAPVRVPALFDIVFPGEFFNVEASPARVHQAIKLLRKRLQTAGTDLGVDEADGFYRLATGGKWGVTIPAEGLPADVTVLQARVLRRALGEKEFGAADVARILGLSLRAAQEFLKAAFEKHLVRRRVHGRSFAYLLR